MQSIEGNNASKPLILTTKQQDVLEALQSKETEKYPLSQWYLGALYALNNHYNPDRISQAAQSLRELLEKLSWIVHGNDVRSNTSHFHNLRGNINDLISKSKKRCSEGWKGGQIDKNLAKALTKVEEYLELNKQPNRRKQIQQAIATIDPMVDRLDSEIQEAKRNQLFNLWDRLEGFAHHKRNPDVEEFHNCLEELEGMVFDLLALITAQDQKEIQTILRHPDRSESDVERTFSLIERRGANFVFFFTQISEKSDVTWLPFLEKKGYFANPPKAHLPDDGSVIFPFWWPIRYLAKISSHAPNEVIRIVLQLPKINNPRVYDGILDIALQLQGEQSTKLKPKILEYTGIGHQFLPYKYTELLAHWTAENQTSDALGLLKVLVTLADQSQSTDQDTLPNPLSRVELWDYRDLMSEGVHPLAKKEPYQVALILIDTTANMIRLRTHQDRVDKEQDFSDIWFARLYETDKNYSNPDKTLVHTLTFACEMVFEKSHDAIVDLDKLLRKQQGKIFKRLRQHLYAQYPNEQTKPWIRELILEREDYHQWEHSYEFQQMIRSACKYFGETLFTKEERIQIFDAIRSGPPKEEFIKEEFQKRQYYFHRQQLAPFASVLFGEYKTYFQKLESEADDPISDEDYPPFAIKSGSVSNLSPYSSEDLANLTDEKLLTHINNWEEENKSSERDLFVRITVEALADTFQTVFKESIIPNPYRLKFWMENREKIERPIYIRAMIDAMQTDVKTKNFNKLDEWLAFSEWVLTHSDRKHNESYRRSDESRGNPDWSRTRRSIGAFIGVCFEEDVDVPITAQGKLAKLLETLCTQFDWRLDKNIPVILNRYDPLTEGINNTRSRALQELINFGLWLRRYDREHKVSTVTAILERRFAQETEYPLTVPEYAELAANYHRIFYLNETSAVEHKSDFFPQSKLPEWAAAFSSFVLCNQAFKPIFKVLQDDFNFALQNLSHFENAEPSGREPIDVLGKHLFTYYSWDMYPLRGTESLLERFYEQTENKPSLWANLFNYVGRGLQNSKEQIDQDLKNRIIAFFEWRFEQGEPTELQHFTSWLKAECLDAKWRLDTYSEILNVCENEIRDKPTRLGTLCDMLPDHTPKVIECLAKIAANTTYILAEEVRVILKAGRESGDESVHRKAELIRESLLKTGRFVLPDLDD
ncbi:MAG: hypothetical protein OXI63_15830 [Candidatus Poribacteria bacterium]|nr:hypothetical protein [Candidatus Poribacteria bacterium]